jgi:hypothetical protein
MYVRNPGNGYDLALPSGESMSRKWPQAWQLGMKQLLATDFLFSDLRECLTAREDEGNNIL